jgi:sec-independent protein translocase protein TatB
VLGPERLPKVARTAGHLFGRLQRYVATVKADLNREIDMSELSKVKQEVQEAARAFEQSAQQNAQSIEAEVKAVSASLDPIAPIDPLNPLEPPATDIPAIVTTPTQAELLAKQELGLTGDGDPGSFVTTAAPISPGQRQTAQAVSPVMETGKQCMLDLGIEPVRRAVS